MDARLFFRVIGIVLMLGALAAADEQSAPKEDLDACLMEIQELKADINLLNLINGLHLTEEQIQGILREAKRVEKDMGPVFHALRKDLPDLKEELELLSTVRDSLHKDGEVPHVLKARYEVHQNRQRSRVRAWKLRPQVLKRVQDGANRVQGILTAAQQEIIIDYKPCLIPPKNLKNPVRVGQAKDFGPMQRVLEKIRELPDPVYANQMDEILESVLKNVERHVGVMKEEDRFEFLDKMLEISETARNMNDVEFELNKTDLAKKLEPVDRAEILKKCLDEMGVVRYQLQGKITQFLLVPRIIPILEKRLQKMKGEEKRDASIPLSRQDKEMCP